MLTTPEVAVTGIRHHPTLEDLSKMGRIDNDFSLKNSIISTVIHPNRTGVDALESELKLDNVES